MPDYCIECKSSDISNIEPGETQGEQAFFDVKCNKCGTKWREHYTLMRIEKDE